MGIIRTAPQSANVLPPRPHRNVAGQRQKQYNGLRRSGEAGYTIYIGPNCCLIENVRIGNNVTIGSGSVVTHDIPDNATVAGNYAKVLNYDRPGKYVENRWNETGN